MTQISETPKPSALAPQPDERAANERPAFSDENELRIERWVLLYLVGFVLILTTVIAHAAGWTSRQVADLPAAFGALLLAAPVFWAAAKDLWAGRASSWILASLAVLAALAINEFVMAGLLAFLLLLFDQIVHRTAWGARKAIHQLIRLTPHNARLVEDGGEREAPLAQVKPGMIVRVRPGENLPVDGEVVTGQSAVNQASLTGESMPIEVEPGENVYAGTSNLTGVIDLRVTSVGAETTIGKVSELIQAAESARSPRQQMIEQVAAYFVPAALAIAGVVWYFFSQSGAPDAGDIATRRAIAVLLVAFPQALLLATPTATVAAFTAAARLGVLIKKPQQLESAANVDTVVFDKTGTLTTGVFEVARLAPASDVEPAELLSAAATGEQHSNHPLARSIIATAEKAHVEIRESPDFEEIHGRGVCAKTQAGEEILVGRSAWITERLPGVRQAIAKVEEQIEGMTGVHVARGGAYLGAVGLEDKLKNNATEVIQRLRALGVKRVSMFTGDRTSVAIRVGKAVGVDHIESECLPEEKHQRLRAMMQAGRRILFVGDGINDGPCLAAADVGVAMGLAGSDIAANSAGVALMNDDLSRTPFLIDLSRRTRSVLSQNIGVALALVIVGLALAATGQLSVFAALAYHLVGDVIVTLNSFRLVRFGEEMAEPDAHARPIATQRSATVSLRPSAVM